MPPAPRLLPSYRSCQQCKISCSSAMSAPVQSLFITLKRSFAGTREHHVRILQGLGLRYRQQTVQQPNKEHVRGAINKVSCCYARVCSGLPSDGCLLPARWTGDALAGRQAECGSSLWQEAGLPLALTNRSRCIPCRCATCCSSRLTSSGRRGLRQRLQPRRRGRPSSCGTDGPRTSSWPE